MFCPKCGTENPDNGKFCRSCGTDLGNVSAALTGKLSGSQAIQLKDKKGKPIHWESAITKIFSGLGLLAVAIVLGATGIAGGRFWWFWMLIPAFGALGSGIAQMVQLKKIENGSLIVEPYSQNAFSPNSSGGALPPSQEDYDYIENLAASGKESEAIKAYRRMTGARLKDAKNAVERIRRGEMKQAFPNIASNNQPQNNQPHEYVAPRRSIYDTGELNIPPSVTEGTTRHLEVNKEGETMTLPPEK